MAKRRLTGKTLAALTPNPTSSAPPQREDEDAVLPCREPAAAMAKRRLTGKTLAALTPYPTSSAPPQREDEDAVLPCRSDNVLLESRGSNDDVVDVRGVLLDALRCEVALEVASASAGLNSAAHGQAFPCPLCPFRRMAR